MRDDTWYIHELETTVSAASHIGPRATQEDRYVVSQISDSCWLFGLFDGTVGCLASESAKQMIVDFFVGSHGWKNYLTDDRDISNLIQGIRETYEVLDRAIIQRCREMNQPYSTSTCVLCVLSRNILVTSHLGDSRVCLVDSSGSKFITKDHRPSDPLERKRIEAHGGSVVYLVGHGSKPYLRGGDFLDRKRAGDQPMQLQYSRALGGKDLKPFGLSAEPDITVNDITDIKKLIIGSDGLWDTLSPDDAGRLTGDATDLINNVLEQCTDNITAVVISR
jgi:serine/threonine protein phosphatase PrpC